MSINIYCLYGDYNVGKTYLANKIVESHSSSFVRLSFAQKVKENFVKEIEPSLTLDDLNNREIKEKYRSKIIDYAENMKTIKGEDVWAKLIINEIEEIHKTKKINNFIIDDLRFVVEYETLIEFIFKNKGKLYLIHLISNNSYEDPQTSDLKAMIDNNRNRVLFEYYTFFNDYTDKTIKEIERELYSQN
jgi:hypothetical protein